jgi:hypothetical protein
MQALKKAFRQRFSRVHVIVQTGTRLLPLWLLLFFASCRETAPEANAPSGNVVARVFDYKLYSSELKDVIPAGTPKDDSIRMAGSFINTWVREMLLVHKAEQNLSAARKNVEKQLKAYRNSLIIYEYEKALVEQQLDTLVSDTEIEKYYNEHPADFALRDIIVKVIYVKTDKNAPNLPRLRNWMRSEKPQDRVELNSYCRQFAENFYLNDDSWLLFDDLIKEIPIETDNKELFLKNNKYLEVSDSTNLYLINFKGYMARDSRSPLAFEKENIRKILLNQRKRQLIDRMRDDLYREATESDDIEIYNK